MSAEAMPLAYVSTIVPSPVGALTVIASDRGLAAILWENDDPSRVRLNVTAAMPAHPVLRAVERQLGEYFAGERRAFALTLDLIGTEFQKTVWAALLTIPFGQTRSYGDIARQIGHPKAARAVGAANGRNPISIVTPCHRAIGASGALTGSPAASLSSGSSWRSNPAKAAFRPSRRRFAAWQDEAPRHT
ncbi:methylated-DNA--[protein]-cysteine S-methyltransferase [Methylobacterium soli]|uniref:methylated-DNA--[protein]-cysteine S-methyltransferase n=1 Tax=Methylobacterium soli TaxID=553447 RepID=UPI00207E816F|nr:methylated-DNA--[protein]-cysteine S-methyltransferase [Methylobacterium soli]GJE46367.1 Methylated-DNA--protein-cysteine methyltransferase [Methylobacterium soli]